MKNKTKSIKMLGELDMKTPIKALVFDVYGTLFDVHSVEKKCEALYKGNGAEISQIWRQKQLEYSFLRQIMGQYEPFKQVTLDALKFALQTLELSYDDAQLQSILSEYERLEAYVEVEQVLSEANDKQLVIFSNGSRDMLEPLIEQSGLAQYFDSVISVDDIKQYKPSPASYMQVLNTLDLKREEVLFMSSNGWDISGAKSFGFKTAWINRSGSPVEELNLEPDYIFQDLNGILDLL